MTVIDLTAPAISYESCYQRIVDPLLPHQLQVNWGPSNRTVVGRCNCGEYLGAYPPQQAGSLDIVKMTYEQHVVSLL